MTPLERKRYDRQLRTHEFTNNVEQAFGKFEEKAVNPNFRSGVGGNDGAGKEKDIRILIDHVVTAGKHGWK